MKKSELTTLEALALEEKERARRKRLWDRFVEVRRAIWKGEYDDEGTRG